jgi:hypothetical protein
LANTGGRRDFGADTSLAGLMAWNGNVGNFLTDIGILYDDQLGNIPVVYTLTQYDETGLGNPLNDPARPEKSLGATYYNGQRIGKGFSSATWFPPVDSTISTNSKGLKATITNFYGRFFNFAGLKMDPPPTGGSAPYVALSDGRKITVIEDPTAVDFDLKDRLWIADNGADQNIKIFDLTQSLTTPVETFGEKGGVYAGPRIGASGPFRFWGPRGIAHDRDGNIYIGCTGMPMMTVGGTDIRKFTPDGSTLLWQVQGCFLQTADSDPLSKGLEMFTNGKHMTMDYTKDPGQSWAWSGVTLDPFRYPHDPRTTTQHESVWVRRVGGKLLYFMGDMVGSRIGIWRALDNSEIAVPAAYLTLRDTYQHVESPSVSQLFAHQPIWNATEDNKRLRWYWRDSDGDTQMQASEYGTYDNWTIYSQGIDIDDNGGIWYGGGGKANTYFRGGGLQYWPCSGVDAHGVPIYDFANPQRFDVPFTDHQGGVARLKYIAATDTMYLAATGDGYYSWALYRYDHFTDPAKQTLAYVTNTGFYAAAKGTDIHLDTTSWPMTLPYSFTADADYIYMAYIDKGKDSRVRGEVGIYDAHTGQEIDFIVPGSEIGINCGAVDVVNGINVTTDAQGWKIITLEDDGGTKVITYRWKP